MTGRPSSTTLPLAPLAPLARDDELHSLRLLARRLRMLGRHDAARRAELHAEQLEAATTAAGTTATLRG